MGRGSAKDSSPKKPGKKAPAKRRAASKRAIKIAGRERAPGAGAEAQAAKLARQLHEAQARQEATSEILRVISQSPDDAQPVFNAIVLAAVRLLGCDTVHFLRRDGATWSPVALAGPKGLMKALAKTPLPVDPNANFASRVILSRKNLHLPDWSKIDLPPFERWTQEVRGINSSLLLPLLRGKECIGVLAIGSKLVNHFGKSDIALAESFRDQALIAIENARLFNETKESLARQTAMAQILEVINNSPGDLKPVFDAVLESAIRLCGAGFGVLTLYNGDDMHQVVAMLGGRPEFADMFKDPIHLGPGTGVGRLVRGESYVHIPDAADDDAYRSGHPVRRALVDVAGARTYLAVPIRRDKVMLGSFTIYRREVRLFSSDMIALLQNFAAQAAIAIDNARLFNETREALERQTATADILKVIASSPSDVQPVFDAIAGSARRLLGSFTAVVTRIIDGVVHLAASTAENEATAQAMWRLLPYPLASDRIHARVARTGQVVVTVDIEAATHVPQDVKEFAKTVGWRSMVVVPMLRNNVAIGTIGITRRDPGAFEDKTVDLLKTFADQAVIAIENARLFNETKEALERQTATADILKVIASSPDDVQPVFEAIVSSAVRLVGAFSAGVYRFVGGVVHLAAITSTSPAGDAALRARYPRPIEDTAFGIAHAGEVFQVADTENDERLRDIARERGFRSVVQVPLRSSGISIGVIAVARPTAGVFAAHHVDLLQTFADQAVIAIENVRLFNETQEALERQTATAEILKVIASSPDDVQPVFDAIVSSAARLIGGFSAGVYRFVDGFVHLAAITATTPAADEALRARFPRRFEDTGFSTADEVLQVADTENEPKWSMRDIGRERGFRSVVFVPLRSAGISIGTITVSRKEPGAFAAHHIDLLQTFADQAVIAIENVRLFNETQEALERQTATADILKVIASSPDNVQPVFEAIVASAARLIGAFSAGVYRFVDGVVYLAAITSTTPAGDEALRARFPRPIDETNFTIAEAGEVSQVADTENGERLQLRDIARERGFRSIVWVPLRSSGISIGAIAVSRKEPGLFAAHHIDLLQTFADQAVIAIENVRLFKETQEALERQTATADILKVIASSPEDVQPVFEAIAERSNRIVDGRSTAVYSLVDGILHLKAFTPMNPEADAKLRAFFPLRLSEMIWGETIARGDMYEVEDMQDPSFPQDVRDLGQSRGFRSLLIVPLLRDGQTIGAIGVTRVAPGRSSAHHIQLLRTFADQAVIAIENVRLFKETQEALQRQTATADILKVIASSPSDVKPVFDQILNSIEHLIKSDERVIVLAGDDGMIRVGAAHSPRGDDLYKLFPRPLKGSAAEIVIRERRLLAFADVPNDPESPASLKAVASRSGARSVMMAPLLSESRAIGSIVVSRETVDPFNESECSLLSTFADQAVIAIENVRLFNETKEALEQQTATSEVLEIISSSPGELDPVFQKMLENACRVCEANFGIMQLWDGECFTSPAAHNVPPELAARRINVRIPAHPLTGLYAAAQTHKIVHRADVRESAAYRAGVPNVVEIADIGGARTLVIVPMLKEDQFLGAITIYRQEIRPFTDKQIALVENFTRQAVIAIENTRLLRELRKRTDDLQESLQQQTATADVLKVISRSTFDLDAVLTTLTQSAVGLCRAARGAVFLRDGDVLRVRANAGTAPEFIDFLDANPIAATPQTFTGRTFLTGEVTHLPDVLADPDYDFGQAPQIGQFRSALGVPLVRQGRVEGVFSLSRPEPGGFTDREIELIRTFADQAVIAIENVRLFNEVQARTKELTASLDDLRAAQDRLVQTEKLASLGQLTAGIAHEIKNPLNFVNNFSALSAELTDELNDTLKDVALSDRLRDEVGELTKLLKQNLEKVVQHGKRADSIVKNMLLHSRAGAGEQRSADVNALVEESLNLAYHGARAERPGFNITLQRDFDTGAGSAELFPQEITRALLNLISNGFYAATRRNGETGFEPTLLATTKNLGGSVEIRIRDNGTGIPPEVKEKMFNPFFTTKPAGEGTGLGLSMTHDIVVKQHGGKIDVATKPGEFTEFTIVLPRSGSPQTAR